jgi:hypothetical protein
MPVGTFMPERREEKAGDGARRRTIWSRIIAKYNEECAKKETKMMMDAKRRSRRSRGEHQ